MSNRLAIFDCDGTLIDSQHVIIEAMTRCFEEASLVPPSERDIRRIVGLSLEKAIAQLAPNLPNTQHYALADGYRQCFRTMRAKGALHEPLYDGIAQAIDALDASGWLLGVATGKSDRGLVSCLQSHGLLPKFVSLQTADRHPSKPHPSMAYAAMADAGAEAACSVMIGDTAFDMAMARQAGIYAVGVTWGYHDPEDLLQAGAHVIIDDPRQIPSTLEALLA